MASIHPNDSKHFTHTNLLPFNGDKLPFPKFEKPKFVGFFSIDSNRQFINDQSQLRYLKLPKDDTFPLDLNKGMQLVKRKNEAAYDEKLEHVLQFIKTNLDVLKQFPNLSSNEPKQNVLKFNFICLRGLLRLIMCTPFENKDWIIRATKYRGTIYLHKVDTESEKYQRAHETAEQQRMTSFGFKFEQYCLSESPYTNADSSHPVNECTEFVGMFKTKINSQLKILYGAEMDGVFNNEEIILKNFIGSDKLKFVELKTRFSDLSPRQLETFKRYKLRNWWCQSFLVGIQDLFIGLRTSEGYIKQIKHTNIKDLIDYSYWSPTSCANFLLRFLSYLNEIMHNIDCPYTTFEIYFNSRTHRITYRSHPDRTDKSFLPDWYIKLIA